MVWHTTGCWYSETIDTTGHLDRTYSICKCNHTTNFAVLVDITNSEIRDDAKNILTIISSLTTIFCSLGAIYFIRRQTSNSMYNFEKNKLKMQSNRSRLNLRISIFLIASHLLVLLVMDRTEWGLFCGFSALALLYFLLTTFTFMLMLSVHLYMSTSKKFLFSVFTFRSLSIIAYIGPLFIVLFSMLYVNYIESPKIMDSGNDNDNDTESEINEWQWRKTINSMTGPYL